MAYKTNLFKLGKYTKVALLGLTLTLAACSSNKLQTVTYVEGNEAKLYSMATNNLDHKNYTQASNLLTQLSLQYPFGVHGQDVKVLQAYTAYKQKNFSAVTSYVEKYFADSSATMLDADYMLLISALASYKADITAFQSLFGLDLSKVDLKNSELAIAQLKTLIQKYPSSIYAPYAVKFYNYLINLVAKHNLDVAKFYLKYDNPLAAQKRAYTTVSNFGNTVYLEPALAVIEKASKEVGLNASKDADTIRAEAAKLPQIPYVGKLPPMEDDFLVPLLLKNAAKEASAAAK